MAKFNADSTADLRKIARTFNMTEREALEYILSNLASACDTLSRNGLDRIDLVTASENRNMTISRALFSKTPRRRGIVDCTE